MNIKKVIIDNIKGIGHLELTQPLLPNRPNVLVAPNGFGKSSLSIAFQKVSEGNITLKPEEFYMNDTNNFPTLDLELTDGSRIKADNSSNTILGQFSVHVINNQLEPKATAQHFGKVVTAKASLSIKPTSIIRRIPKKVSFDYKITDMKQLFGQNSKVLFDISRIYGNIVYIYQIEKGIDFHVFDLKPYNIAIKAAINTINQMPGTTTANIIKSIAQNNFLFNLGVPEYAALCANIKSVLNLTDDTDAFLAGWQFINVRKKMRGNYKKAVAYGEYLRKKAEVDVTLDHLNPVKNRFYIQSSEHKGSLIVNWPKANQISNGERDIMVFIAQLLECEYQSSKNCILIIDEFFDYLDDANLIAFQYYVSNLINKFIHSKRLIFPILLTHLEPNYLKHFYFNDKKLNVCYLKETKAKISKEMVKIVKNREKQLVKDELDSYYFHYNPNGKNIDVTKKFIEVGLNKDWGTPIAFRKKVDRETRTYCLQPNNKFDPLAVCFSIRIQIEELVYNQLNENDQKEFIDTHGTMEKLKFAQTKGVSVPETYFLLGIIYNHPLHNTDEDMSRPLGMKLDNIVIKKMIENLWKT